MAAEAVGGAFLSSFLGVLLDRLSSPDFVNLIRGKKLDRKLHQRLEITLCAARAVLNDAELKQIKDHEVKKWLDKLKDAVYAADDLLDEVSTVADIQKAAGNSLSRYLNLQDKEIVTRMEDIIDTLESIVKQKDVLGLKEIPKENMSWRVTTSLVKISEIYGRDKDKEAMVKLLLDDDANDRETTVIPVVGMGGIGKTTLAQMVYHDHKVKHHFDFQAWVCVSEEFDVVQVTRTIVESITYSSCDMNDLNLLQRDLEEKLARKKFFVVLDDVWNENCDDWNKLLKPFQNGVKGSKILITTRSRKVASAVQTIPSYDLSLLSQEDCWLVLAKHALLPIELMVNSTLEKIGKEIVNKCSGLPLAAQTLGGLLRGNYEIQYWSHILKSEIWELSEGESKIIPALRVSYYYLPLYLRDCFVYCSLYPKDYQFNKHELVLLWMAENYLQPMGRKTLEKIGYEYFDELVSKSFFQPLHDSRSIFVMHDLIHDLATFYAGEFFYRAEELESATGIGNLHIKTHHLSHNAKGKYPISKLLAACDTVKHTRTFLEINLEPWDPYPTLDPFDIINAPCILISKLKHLRVLSFKSFPLDHDSLPDSIGDLIHLRYLDLSHTYIKSLPESMSKLYNLQTLKLYGCILLEALPIGLQDLVNLRHLDIRETSLKEMPKGMNRLKQLQILSDFIVGKHEGNGIRELGQLADLHGTLCIKNLENTTNGVEAWEARMDEKKHIDVLELNWSTDEDVADSLIERDVLDKLQPHSNLQELIIRGYRGTTFADWLGDSSYCNMTELTLVDCWNCCMLPSLGQIPFLKHLWISHLVGLPSIGAEFYKNGELRWETPFPSLETLHFNRMSCWKEWHSTEYNAFPRLKELKISDCSVLEGDLPDHLPSLEKLTVIGCKHLTCSLPRTPMLLKLSILDSRKVRLQELPLSLCSLRVGGSDLVESVMDAISHSEPNCLQHLAISRCSSAISFPAACMLASLLTLEISDCKKIEFPMQQQYELLQYLRIHQGHDSDTFFPLAAFPNIRTLEIGRCNNAKSLVALRLQDASLSNLSSLTISQCASLMSFSSLSQLQLLTIEHCPEIDSFPDPLPPKLRQLCIRNCKKLVRCLATMGFHSHSLTLLHIEGACESVKSFPNESFLLPSLKFLYLQGFTSLETLDCKGLAGFASLQKLTITDCPKLENMAGGKLPISLIQLSISENPLLGRRLHMKDSQIWPKISHIHCIKVDQRRIW